MTLLQNISSTANLNKAWKLLNKNNKDSKGLSGISIKDFELNLTKNINSLSESLRNGTFKFQALKGVTIPKSEKGKRPLRIPEIKDRLVHKALAIRLEKDLNKIYNLDNDYSFAYVKGKSIKMAIDKMTLYYNQGYKTILKVDIIKFFDTISSEKLLLDICQKLKDTSIDDLLDRAVNQSIGNKKEIGERDYKKYFEIAEHGIPQGNSLSPLLSNIYLSSFDKRAKKEKFRMIRYADDFIIMTTNNTNALIAHDIAKEELLRLDLNIHVLGEPNSKTQIFDPRQTKFVFLSVRFDGSRCTVSQEKIQELNDHLKNLISVDFFKIHFKEDFGLIQALTKIKNYLDGWLAAYFFLDIEKQVEELDKQVNVVLLKLFKSFSFNLNSSNLSKISFKGKSNTVLGLNPLQRKYSGIPLYANKLKTLKKSLIYPPILGQA